MRGGTSRHPRYELSSRTKFLQFIRAEFVPVHERPDVSAEIDLEERRVHLSGSVDRRKLNNERKR